MDENSRANLNDEGSAADAVDAESSQGPANQVGTVCQRPGSKTGTAPERKIWAKGIGVSRTPQHTLHYYHKGEKVNSMEIE